MRKGNRKNISLPNVKEKDPSYVAKSINIVKKGCYGSNRQLRIDEAYGDYSMNLFRMKNKQKYIRDIPSAFSPSIKDLLRLKVDGLKDNRIATEHNERVDKIINTPKQIYLKEIRLVREAEQKRKAEKRKNNEFVMGYDEELREHNQHLSFQYLSKHESANWFKVKDFSSQYKAPQLHSSYKEAFTTPRPKFKKRTGFVFLSDRLRKTNQLTKFLQ